MARTTRPFGDGAIAALLGVVGVVLLLNSVRENSCLLLAKELHGLEQKVQQLEDRREILQVARREICSESRIAPKALAQGLVPQTGARVVYTVAAPVEESVGFARSALASVRRGARALLPQTDSYSFE